MRTALAFGSLALTLAFVVACKGDKPAIATLTKAEGPVEKQTGQEAWGGAKVGTKFFIGDAARTADGSAGLEVAGGAQIAMQPHTVLRFGGQEGSSKIAVELGAIDLSGTGNYGLDIGDVKLSKGTVRITAKGEGKSSVELLIGDAEVTNIAGINIDLVIGQAVDLDMEVTVANANANVDAGVGDAGVPIPDAPEVVASDGEATIEVTGKNADVWLPGSNAWVELPAGAGTLPKGAKVRAGKGTTIKITARGTTLDLAGGARAVLGEDLVMLLELGVARASTPANTAGTVKLPGGAVALASTPSGTEARVDVNAREARVTVTRGNARLTGGNGGELAMNRGETANLAKLGTIRVVEAIPTYFDFKATVGGSYTIHDPKGATAVKFDFAGKCPDGGFIEMDQDARYRTAKVSAGKDSANMMVSGSGWAYRLRCSSGGGDSAAVASGRISVMRDAGTRKLLKELAMDIDADGRAYTLTYFSVPPNIGVRIKGEGGPFTLHLAQGGQSETFTGPGPKITIPGKNLKEGTYTYWVVRGGTKDPKVSTLKVVFNNQAPQVYLEAPINGRPWEGQIDVRGVVLPGWSAAIDDVAIPMDSQRRFKATVPRPAGQALAIKLSHPQRGTHYYLRREK